MKKSNTVLLLFTLSLFACGEDQSPAPCEGEPVSSVILNVTDAFSGDSVPGVRAMYWNNGVGRTPCTFDRSGALNCGVEVLGPIDIEVWADGYRSARLSQTVEAGTCHVQQQAVSVRLEPREEEDCCFMFVPVAVLLTVMRETPDGLEKIAEPSAVYSYDDGPETPCEHEGGEALSCGYYEGTVRYTVIAPEGYESVTKEVAVQAIPDDPCGALDIKWVSVILPLKGTDLVSQ